MKKKGLVISTIIGIMLFTTFIKVYAITSKITEEDLANLNNLETKTKIAEIVVDDAQKTELINPEEITTIEVEYGNIKNSNSDKEEAVVSAYFDPNLTLVSIYEKNDDGTYDFLAPVGTFYVVDEIILSNLENLNKDILFLREFADQSIGGYEQSKFLRGYIFDNNELTSVINTPEEIRADWNTLWDGIDETEGSQWKRVTRDSEIKLENGNYPKIIAKRDHKYFISSNTEAKNIPNDESYKELDSAVIEDIFYWSDKYNMFILDEAVDSSTGEDVAIIEEFKELPYNLVPELENFSDKVRIVRENGVMEIVSEKDLLYN